MRNKFKLLLILFGIIICLASAVTSQSSNEFKQKYGNPQDNRFVIRQDSDQDVEMSVSYSDFGKAYKLFIERKDSRLTDDQVLTAMTKEVVDEILEELIPSEKRGELIREGAFRAGCSSIIAREYEEVSIYHAGICSADGKEKIRSTTVEWKKLKPVEVEK